MPLTMLLKQAMATVAREQIIPVLLGSALYYSIEGEREGNQGGLGQGGGNFGKRRQNSWDRGGGMECDEDDLSEILFNLLYGSSKSIHNNAVSFSLCNMNNIHFFSKRLGDVLRGEEEQTYYKSIYKCLHLSQL